jgi:hypothetical protein
VWCSSACVCVCVCSELIARIRSDPIATFVLFPAADALTAPQFVERFKASAAPPAAQRFDPIAFAAQQKIPANSIASPPIVRTSTTTPAAAAVTAAAAAVPSASPSAVTAAPAAAAGTAETTTATAADAADAKSGAPAAVLSTAGGAADAAGGAVVGVSDERRIRIVILDGTWNMARMLKRRLNKMLSAARLAVAHVTLTNSTRKEFGGLRRNSCKERVQTFAAFIHLCRELGEPNHLTDQLRPPLAALMKAYHTQAPGKPMLVD